MQCPACNLALPTDARFCAACGKPLPGATGPGPARSTKWVLIVVACAAVPFLIAVLGIIAAIAIPNFVNAVDRGKQKRTMADIRSIGVALESYARAHREYPVAGDLATLKSSLVPEYIPVLPAQDGWGNPIQVTSEETTYEIVSFGKGGEPGPCDEGKTERFEDDICFRDGEFKQWPEGVQR